MNQSDKSKSIIQTCCDKVKKQWLRLRDAITRKEMQTIEQLADNNSTDSVTRRRFSHLITWTVLSFVVVILIWAKLAVLDKVTHGEGKVIPSSQIQVIQNLEGGIVEKIFVREGDFVEKNQTLMQIDATQFQSSTAENKVNLDLLKLRIERLEALTQKVEFKPGASQAKAYPIIVQLEKLLYKIRIKQLEQLKKSYEYANTEYLLSKPLVKKGAASEVEVIQKQRAANEARSKLKSLQSDMLDELSKAKSEMKGLHEIQVAHRDRLNRTGVRSPVKGIVKKLHVNTVGGVIKPGMDLIEVVPLEGTLLVETRISPEDIGFLHPNQKATVKISAYDYSVYGSLDAKVEQISADTLYDEKKKETYYLVRVRTAKNHLGSDAKPLPIIPGMHATVDVMTGEKSVLDMILTPLREAKEKALRER